MAKSLFNFVQKRGSDANCWTRHRPARPHVGNGLCQECEDTVAREGYEAQLPARVRGGSAAAKPDPAAVAVVVDPAKSVVVAEAVQPPEALMGQLPAKTTQLIQSFIANQEISLAQLRHLAEVIPLTSQEAMDDGKAVLDEAHAMAGRLRQFLDHYLAPLQSLEQEYRKLIYPTLKTAQDVKAYMAGRLSEALQLAQTAQVQALAAIETAAKAGAPLPEGAVEAAQGFQLAGTRTKKSWRFTEGKTVSDLLQARPDLMIPDKAAIDGLLRILEDKIGEATGGVLEAYDVPIPAASKAS